VDHSCCEGSAAPARPACWKVCPTTATRCSAPRSAPATRS
jgi:hypothetical protein